MSSGNPAVISTKNPRLSAYGVDLSGFTEMQAAFVAHRLEGHEPVKAAELAGYANPPVAAWQNLQNSALVSALSEAAGKMLQAGAIDAISYVIQLIRDANVSPKIRLDASKTLMDRAGYLPPSRNAVEAGDKSNGEMTSEELRAFIAAAQNTLAERATMVDSDATASQPSTQVSDYME